MEVLIPITLFICLAGVLILRPVTKRVGALLEAMAEERRLLLRGRVSEEHLTRTTELLERLNSRLDMLEDRVRFVEALREDPVRQRRSLSGVRD